jgi:4-methylaminobutanoate oxidase (formaldehyde-forming)
VHGLFVAPGFCAHGIAGAAVSGRVMSEWLLDGRAVVRHLEDGHPALRRGLPEPRLRACPRRRGVLDLTTTSTIPTSDAWRDGRSDAHRVSPPGRAGLRVRGEKSGWGTPELVRPNAATPTRRRPRPRVLGRRALERGDRRRGARVPRPRRALRRDQLLQDGDVRRAAAAAFLDRAVRQRRGSPDGSVTYTQLCNDAGGWRVRPDRHPEWSESRFCS